MTHPTGGTPIDTTGTFPSDFARELFTRQYAVTEGETFEQGMQRVADTVFPKKEFPYDNPRLYEWLMGGYGQFGGRVLAGAGTAHGNLLNCFVQDGAPHIAGTDAWVMELAKRLALVTKVGGGNGLNLDPIPEADESFDPDIEAVGRAFLAISKSHPDSDNVQQGRFYDQVRGVYTTKGYHGIEHVYLHDPDESSTGDPTQAVVDQILNDSSSVVTLNVGDSIESIWDVARDMVQYMQNGDDVLVVLSDLRPEGTPVKGSGGNSSGPASFAVEVFDNFARWARLGGAQAAGPVATLRYVFAPTLRVIRQGGSRRGAGMATLTIHHPDLEDFITAKDLSREAEEGDISTFNISVLADSDFMDEAINFPETEAAQLLERIANHAWATGEPGLIFLDTVNEHNPLRDVDGPIFATNPCGEITLYPGEPCDLAAINLAAYWDAEEEDFLWDKLADDTALMVHALDRVLTVEKPPLEVIQAAILDKRRIGLGVMGLADALVRAGFEYDSDDGREMISELIGTIRDAAIKESERLGAIYGVPEGVKRAFDREGMRQYRGRRNIAILTVAPTGTISMMTGVSSGIEPIYSALTYRRIGTEYHEIVHPLLVEIIESLEPSGEYVTPNGNWAWDDIREDIGKHHGSIIGIMGALPRDARLDAFVTAHEVNPLSHVAMQATVQSAFDYTRDFRLSYAGNSISKTINLPNGARPSDVLEVYIEAWESGCKGVTVYRDGSRDLQVLSTSAPVEELTGELPEIEELDEVPEEAHDDTINDIFEDFVRETKRITHKYEQAAGVVPWLKRPAVVTGRSYKYQINGGKVYVQAFHNDENELVEVWTPAPKGSDPNENTAHNIIGRLISLALKYGATPDKVAEALEGHMDESGGIVQGVGYVNSRWDLVAHTIRRFQASLTPEKAVEAPAEEPLVLDSKTPTAKPRLAFRRRESCQDCGSEDIIYADGCLTCRVCGSSKCG